MIFPFTAAMIGAIYFMIFLKKQQKGGLIVLDEITWMGSKDPTFMPKLKTAWDWHFKKNNKLIMIITGSNSTWIQKNILSSTGFYGRVSLRILLKELPIEDCNVFLGGLAWHRSSI